MRPPDSPAKPLDLDRVIDTLRDGEPGRDRIDLAMGTSAFDPGEWVSGELLHWNRSRGVAYGALAGDEMLRREIAESAGEDHRTEIDPWRVVVTDGGAGALATVLLTLVGAGDEVVVPRLHFPALPRLVRLAGGTCVYADVDADMNPTPASIRAVMTSRTRAVVVNSPGNPFGNVMTAADLQRIADLGVPLVSDEVYGGLADDAPAPSVAALEGDVYAVSSFSKVFAAGGLRIGYAVVPAAARERVLAVRALLNVCPSTPSQVLARDLLRNKHTLRRRHLDLLRRHRATLVDECRELGLPLAATPRNGFFAVVALHPDEPRSSLEVALDLAREQNVAVAPGTDFAPDDPRFLRVNYACQTRLLRPGLRRLAAGLS